MKAALKAAAHAVATAAVVPQLISFWIRSALMGKDRAIEGSTQALSLVPGIVGQYLRRASSRASSRWLRPHRNDRVRRDSFPSRRTARRVSYVGPRCHLGLVHLERGVLVADGVHIPSGAHTHGTELGVPIHQQEGRRTMVRIGAGSWIGSNAVVLADVGRETIVGAGSVVTQPLPDRVIAGGVPARVIRQRVPADASA
jgi:acetyltransferase-like isoleucine patch superfamily enzyme